MAYVRSIPVEKEPVACGALVPGRKGTGCLWYREAVRSSQKQLEAARSSRRQPEAARSSPGAARSSQKQPEAARSSPGAARSN